MSICLRHPSISLVLVRNGWTREGEREHQGDHHHHDREGGNVFRTKESSEMFSGKNHSRVIVIQSLLML